MRLEIMIGNSDTLIHPIKGNRVLIGSSESCDIILPANNISRKHLIVTVENDQYYVIDQGSTNGSYINEERLVPGRRVEFTSFFPVRLGDDVLISLLSDDEPNLDDKEDDLSAAAQSLSSRPVKTDHEATSVISLKQLKEVKTDHLIKRREERRKQVKKKKAAPPPPPKKTIKIDFVKIFALLLLASAGYYHFFMGPETEAIPEAPVVVAPVPQKVQSPEKKFFLVEEQDIVPREELKSIANNMKCVTDVEQYFCQTFTKSSEVPFGAFQVGTMFFIFLDGTSAIEMVSQQVTFPDPAMEQTEPQKFELLEQHAKHVVALNFIFNIIPENLKTDMVQGMRMTFVFYKVQETGPEMYFALAITPEAIKELRNQIHPEHFETLRNPGNYISTIAAQYYRLY